MFFNRPIFSCNYRNIIKYSLTCNIPPAHGTNGNVCFGWVRNVVAEKCRGGKDTPRVGTDVSSSAHLVSFSIISHFKGES